MDEHLDGLSGSESPELRRSRGTHVAEPLHSARGPARRDSMDDDVDMLFAGEDSDENEEDLELNEDSRDDAAESNDDVNERDANEDNDDDDDDDDDEPADGEGDGDDDDDDDHGGGEDDDELEADQGDAQPNDAKRPATAGPSGIEQSGEPTNDRVDKTASQPSPRALLQPGAADCPYYDLVPTTAAPQATHCHCMAITRGLRWLVTGGQDGYVRKYDFQQSVTGKVPLTVAQKHAFVDSVQRSGVLLSYWDADDEGRTLPHAEALSCH